jgi:hypothetical protein
MVVFSTTCENEGTVIRGGPQGPPAFQQSDEYTFRWLTIGY